MAYVVPPGTSANIDLTTFTIPPGTSANIIIGGSGSVATVYPTGIAAGSFGSPTLTQPVSIAPSGIAPGAFGSPTVVAAAQNLQPSGFSAGSFGTATIVNAARLLAPAGIAPGAVGTPTMGWTQYVTVLGFASVLGAPSIRNQREYLQPFGITPGIIGTLTRVYDPHAPQTADLISNGIASGAFGTATLSPRYLLATSINPPGLGTPGVTRNPSPLGFDSLALGTPEVAYRTKWVYPSGFDASTVPQPDVSDHHQDVFPSSVLEAGVFGDTGVKNRWQFVTPEGFNAFESNSYTLVENRNKEIKPFGIAPKPVASPIPADDPFDLDFGGIWQNTNDDLSGQALASLLSDDSWTRYARTAVRTADGSGFTDGMSVLTDASYVVTMLFNGVSASMRIYDRATGQWEATVRRTSLSGGSGTISFVDRHGNSSSVGGAGMQVEYDTGHALVKLTGGYGMQWGSDLLIWRPGRIFGVPTAFRRVDQGKYLVRYNLTPIIEVRELNAVTDTTSVLCTFDASWESYAATIAGDYLFFYGFLSGVEGLYKIDLATGTAVTTILKATLDAGWKFSNARDYTQVYAADGKIFVHGLSVLRVFDENLNELRSPQLTGLGSAIPDNGQSRIYPAFAFNGYLTIGGQTRTTGVGEIHETAVFRTSDGKLVRKPTQWGQMVVWNSGQGVTPAGIDSLLQGDPHEMGVGFRNRTITPLGSDTSRFGTATLTKPPALEPAGIAATRWGDAMVADRVRTLIDAGGADTSRYGLGTVWYRVRTVQDAGGQDLSLYGTAYVDRDIRTVDVAGDGLDSAAYGRPKIENWIRTLAPEGIGFDLGLNRQFGSARVSDGLQRTTPLGFPAGTYGTPTIARNERVLLAAGIAPSAGSLPDVQLYKRYLIAHGGESQLFGDTAIFNSRQYVAQGEGAAPTVWGLPYVENHNRVIRTYGADVSRVPTGASVLNNARLIAPTSALGSFGTSAVTHRIRYLAAEGLPAPTPSYWAVVYNRRIILEPSGIGRGRLGVPFVWDNTQHIDCNGSFNLHTSYGTPFVAPRVRNVTVNRFGIDTPPWPLPYIGLRQQYVAPTGPEGAFGAPYLEHHRNIIALHGFDTSKYGEPFVRNKTPQLFAGSLEAPNNPQKPWVSFRVRPLAPAGIKDGTYGLHYVGNRTRYIVPGGVETLRIPLLHQVAFDAPVIPPDQRILLENQGILEADAGRPYINRFSLYPEGFTNTKFGAPRITSTSLFPTSCILAEAEQVPEPTVIGPQYINVSSGSYPDENANGWIDMPGPMGKPGMSPYYLRISEDINGVLEKPEALVDYRSGESLYARPRFGEAGVELKNRSIAQRNELSLYGPSFGDAAVTLRVRKVGPVGLKSERFGFPRLPTGFTITPYWGRDTEEWIEGGDYDTALYGNATVDYVPVYDPYLRPAGLRSEQFGNTDVSLFIRVVAPSGAPTGFEAGIARVHPPEPIIPEGIAGDTGVPAISFRIRSLQPEGFLAFSNGYVPGSFNFGVMRVRHRNVIRPPGHVTSIIPAPIVILPDLGAVATLGDQSAYGRPRVGACAC